MKNLSKFLFILINVLYINFLNAQLSVGGGVVNTYFPVSNISGNTITVGAQAGAATPLAAGDKVMIIQMTGSTDVNGGKYEKVTVSSVSGSTVTVSGLSRAYSFATEKVQLVRIPYDPTGITITSAINAMDWNGTVGGVVSVWTPGTLTLNANVSATGAGFSMEHNQVISGSNVWGGGAGAVDNYGEGGGGGGGYGGGGKAACTPCAADANGVNGGHIGGFLGTGPYNNYEGWKAGGGGAGVGGAAPGASGGPHSGGGGGAANPMAAGCGGDGGDNAGSGGDGAIAGVGGTSGGSYNGASNGGSGGGGGGKWIGGGGGASGGPGTLGGSAGNSGGTGATGSENGGNGGGMAPSNGIGHNYFWCDPGTGDCPDPRLWMGGAGGDFTGVVHGGGIIEVSAGAIVTNNHEFTSHGDDGVSYLGYCDDVAPGVGGIHHVGGNCEILDQQGNPIGGFLTSPRPMAGSGGGGGGIIKVNTGSINGGNLTLCANGGDGGDGGSDNFYGYGSGAPGGPGAIWMNDPGGAVGSNLSGNLPVVGSTVICNAGGQYPIIAANPKSASFAGGPGCSPGRGTVSISGPDPEASCSVTLSSTNPGCGLSNGSVSASATGTAPYTYLWSNGATTSTITNLPSGTYSVTVTDSEASACTANASVSIAPLNAPTVSAVVNTHPGCGQTNGSATASGVGGSAPLSYLWSNGAIGPNLTGVGAGTYTVTVTDAGNCASSTSVSLVNPASPSCMLSATSQPTCASLTGGAASVNGSGGTAPLSYTWSSGGTGTSATGLMGGTYTVTVSDASNCTGVCSVTIDTPQNCCDINAATIQSRVCLNNGTPNLHTDNRIQFTLLVTNSSSALTTYTLAAGGTTISPSTGSYGTPTVYTLGSGTGGGGVTFTITLRDSSFPSTCTRVIQVADPGSCNNAEGCEPVKCGSAVIQVNGN